MPNQPSKPSKTTTMSKTISMHSRTNMLAIYITNITKMPFESQIPSQQAHKLNKIMHAAIMPTYMPVLTAIMSSLSSLTSLNTYMTT